MALFSVACSTTPLYATVPENAAIGRNVTSVLTTSQMGEDDVQCEIVEGDEHGRFIITACRITVARPPYEVTHFITLESNARAKGCPPNKYGIMCEKDCGCENGARCHGFNGACKCQPGWQGVVCDIPHSTVAIIPTPSDSRQIHIKSPLTLECRAFNLAVKGMTWGFPNGTKKWLRRTQEDQISRALEELRRLPIAHGDVAARNVLISGHDVAKLTDFGLARDVYSTISHADSVKTDAEELLPLKWMALESLKCRQFTCESDTWSFGVLLWEIASFGEEPNYQEMVRLTYPNLVEFLRRGMRLLKPRGCPNRLYDVMRSCWRQEPSARPTPEELEQKLTECRHEIDLQFVERESAV
ncbi:PREDICTED: tyrosine-protein kinase SYK-like [Branchiostoma belcheri]|uniref:Tyrosine-protein kinase SYK-like n=1 Tax=Branchiostoma belcheri TaxID=7741 RepID=A0A6P4YRS6_BRABE|nr:PREDICTED: tyrosine-protein kinase SYK-like [Branchiostoma belcheri]